MSNDPRPAFLAYRQAMAKAVALEQVMRLALMEYEARSSNGQLSQDATMALLQKLLHWDFGTLRQQVYQKLKLPKEFLAITDTAKQQRDYLAHNFWITHLRNLRTDRGLKIILRHCTCIEAQFDRVSEYVINETGTDLWRFVRFLDGIESDQRVHADWESLLEAAEATFTNVAPKEITQE